MSIALLVNRFGSLVSVTRYTTGSWVNGNYVDGATSSISARMSIQPLSGRELIQRPELQRTRQYAKAYTNIPLVTASQSAARRADRVTAPDGRRFEVQSVEQWESFTGNLVPHWKVLLAEVNANE